MFQYIYDISCFRKPLHNLQVCTETMLRRSLFSCSNRTSHGLPLMIKIVLKIALELVLVILFLLPAITSEISKKKFCTQSNLEKLRMRLWANSS